MARDVRTEKFVYCLPAIWLIFCLIGCGGGGQDSASQTSATAQSAPAAPGSLAAITQSGEKIALNWTDNADNETGYRIEKSSDYGQTFSLAATLGAGIVGYTDTATSSGSIFCYRVQATNGAGTSAYSNTACASKTSSALTPVVVTDGAGRDWPAAYGKASVSRWRGDKIAAYSLTIDDNCVKDVNWWREQSAAYGFKFTWFLITGYINGPSASYYGTWPPYVTLAAEGHDIQSHTVTHNHTDLTLEEQYSLSRQALIANIPGVKATTLAYPCGYPGYPTCQQANDRELAKKYYIAARGTVGHNNVINETDYYNVDSTGVINITDTSKRWIYFPDIHIYNAAYPKSFGAWQNSLFHGVSGDPETEAATKASIIAGFEYIKAHEADIWFGLFREVAMYGQERETAVVTVTKNTAGEIRFTLTDAMDDMLFDFPLTVKIRLDATWTQLTASQNGMPVDVCLQIYNGGIYALVGAKPDGGEVVIAKVQ